MITVLILAVISLLIILFFTPVYRKVINEFSTPYYFEISNSANQKLEAKLYGYYKYIESVNYGSDIGINIGCITGVTYSNHLHQSSSKPFVVRKTTVKASLKDLSEMVLRINGCDISGSEYSVPLIVASYLTPEIKQDKNEDDIVYLDINFLFKVNSGTHISCEINPLSKATLIFYFNDEKYIKSNYFSILIKGLEKLIKK